MSLRTRLFLLVSALFLATAFLSFFMQSYVMKRAIGESEQNVRERILTLNKENREDLENFVAWLIAESDTRINALLNNISSLKIENARFGPTSANLKRGTWENNAALLLNYNWIDFLQNTNGQQHTTIVPNTSAMKPTYRTEINDQLAWVYFQGRSDPYLAVRIPYQEKENPDTSNGESVYGVDALPYLLFDLKKLSSGTFPSLTPSSLKSIPLPWANDYSLQVDQFAQTLTRTQAQLKTQGFKAASFAPQEVQTILDQAIKFQGGHLFRIPGKSLISTSSMEQTMVEQLEDIVVRYTQVNLIWLLLSLYDTGLFGNDLFAFPAPEGISLFFVHDDVGVGLKTTDVLFPEPIFQDQLYFETHSSPSQQSDLANSLAVIASPHSDTLYFGNTARLIVTKSNQEGEQGYLTIGVDFDKIIQNVYLALRKTILFVQGEKLITAFGKEGKIPSAKIDLPLQEILHNPIGITSWNKDSYFYVNLQPFAALDLHFILLSPEQKEFALLRDLITESRSIVNSILDNLYLTGLILLIVAIFVASRVAKHITQPIAALAQATKQVTLGKLDEITLPSTIRHDELSLLCSSFEEMISGLKEKEKVKGILNKVVSQEIAREILKGKIHLGGEEKKVTLLFADIRGFTALTQNMAPHDVVDLLNMCMTKIALVIEKHHGVIDKFIGDEVMAMFGAPLSLPDAALRSILCAQEILSVVREWNQIRKEQNLPIVEMGIGIHTGIVLVGNMGAENRLNYTATGSNVNLASRICSAAKGMEILITKDTLEEPHVKEKISWEEIPDVTLKGFSDTLTLYRVKSI